MWNEYVAKEGCKLDWDTVNRDIWAVLNKKTDEGTARRKVESAAPGCGIQAYYLLSKWYLAASGVGIADLRAKLMAPSAAKNESDIMSRIENWEKDMILLQKSRRKHRR